MCCATANNWFVLFLFCPSDLDQISPVQDSGIIILESRKSDADQDHLTQDLNAHRARRWDWSSLAVDCQVGSYQGSSVLRSHKLPFALRNLSRSLPPTPYTFPSTLNGTTAKREKGPTTAPAGFVISPKYHVGAKKDRDRIGRLFGFHGPSRHSCDKILALQNLFSEARSRGFSAGVIISQPKVRG